MINLYEVTCMKCKHVYEAVQGNIPIDCVLCGSTYKKVRRSKNESMLGY